MSKLKSIQFSLEEGYQEFSFKVDEESCSAQLQLPSTPDSQHVINGEDFDSESEEHVYIFDELKERFFESFEDVECAAASALIGLRVVRVEKMQNSFCVAFLENKEKVLIKESSCKDYYNKLALFDRVDEFDLQKIDDECFDEDELLKSVS